MTDWGEEDWGAEPTYTRSVPQPPTRSQNFYDEPSYSNDRYGGSADPSSSFELLSIDPRHAGAVIGRGGSNIRELEQQFKCRVNVNNQTGEVRVSGFVEEHRKACAQKIYSIVQERSSGMNAGSRGGGGNNFEEGGDSISIPIQASEIGIVLGRAGSAIQQMQRESGARMRVDRDQCVVVVSGTSESCAKASELVRKTLANREVRPASGVENFRPSYNQDYQQDRPASQSARFAPQMVESGWGDDDWTVGATADAPNSYASNDNHYQQSCYHSEEYNRSSTGYSNYQNRNQNSYGNRSDYRSGGGSSQRSTNREPPPPAPPHTNFEPIDWEACLKQSEEVSNQRWAHLPPVIKNFYQEDPEVSAMLPEEVEEFRKSSNNIIVANLESSSTDPLPNPVTKFEHAFSAYPDIMREIQKNGFKTPSPVQSQAWPLLLSGRDTIAIAQTGTGKTLAFLLPAFIHIEGQVQPREERKGPSVICLCPTRELAQQIYTEVLKYNYHGIKAVCVYGGKARREQIQVCNAGVEIVIATPGRLNDLINSGVISLESVTYLVLDEADRMLDMGFEPDIRKVLLDIRPDRQSVMTSATWPPGVRKMASRYLKNPAQIYVGSLDLNAVHTVRQDIRFVAEEEKRAALFDFLANEMEPHEKLLVFCGRKSTCSDVASELSRNDIPCESIHGDREQQDREDALADFKNSSIRILIATDVASRGLDVADITHVLNFDFPKDMEEYVHRVGRTGRAGRSGIAISFFTRQDWAKAADLIKILEDADQEVPQQLRDMAERFVKHQEKMAQERGFGGGFGGGRGGGGGGGSGCYNCGGDGHMSRECPQPRKTGGGGGGGSGCYNCGGGGHMSRDCPQPRRNGGGNGGRGGSRPRF